MVKNILFRGRAFNDHYQFWSTKLSDAKMFTFQGSVNTYSSSTFREVSFKLNPKHALLLKKYSDFKDLELFILLLSAFKIVSYKYNFDQQIIVGTPLAKRLLKDKIWEQDVFLIHDVNPKCSLKDYINEVNESVLRTYQFQNYPYSVALPDWVDNSVLSNIHICHDGLHVDAERDELKKYDLRFNSSVNRENDEIEIGVAYNESRFSSMDIERISLQLNKVLDYYDNLSVLLEEINIITDEETRILKSFSNIKIETNDESVVTLFEKTVSQYSQQIAISYNEKTISYRDLNESVNRLARFLKNECLIETGQRIGVVMEKSDSAIIALLAVFKSGGTYVPLDPDLPKTRLNYIIKDTGLNIILARTEQLSKLEGFDGDILSVDRIINDLKISSENLSAKPKRSDAAYVIYTSGSTGIPKGVLIGHDGLVIVALDHIEEFKMTANDIYLQFMAFSFDGSILDVFTVLLSGAKLVIPPINVLGDRIAFTKFVDSHHISITTLTPSFLSSLKGAALNSLRILVTAGEEAQPADANAYSKYLTFYNGYGPTEATINSTLFRVEASCEYGKIPIGSPRANKRIYIVNESFQVVPIGGKGEICISGSGLAFGYLNDPDLTTAKFLQNPFEENSRLYRTGDMGRWLGDGSIEYLNRQDQQVKINGYRIEINEIENALNKHPFVLLAIVVVAENELGDTQLIANLMVKEPVPVQSLRDFISGQVPYYMVPSFFRFVDSIPYLPNGKVNRKALAKGGQRHELATNYVPPKNDTEKLLVTIWEKILDRKNIGVLDNFFECNGDSLNAIQVVSRIYKEFGTSIPLKTIFENPTIASLSGILLKSEKVDVESITLSKEDEYYDVSHTQRQIWAIHQVEKNMFAYNMHAAFKFTGEIGFEYVAKTIDTIVKRHEILRTTFHEIDGNPKQRILPIDKYSFNLHYDDISRYDNSEETARGISLADEKHVFDLSKGPLFLAKLLKTARNQHVLLLTFHHIISDGWSIKIFCKEFLTLYETFSKNKPNPLEPLKIQYKDFAIWQDRKIREQTFSDQREYWKNKLDGVQTLNLITDHPRPQVKTYNGDRHAVSLDKGLSEKLKKFSKERGCSLYMTLLAAVKLLMNKYTGQSDIVLGSPTLNRNHVEFENQIGCYINTIALRTKFNEEESFEELLEKVKLTAIEGFENQNYPFNLVLEDLSLERKNERSLLFDVLVDINPFVGEWDQVKHIDGLKIEELDNDFNKCYFDIIMVFTNREDHINASFAYNVDLFSKARIERMLNHLVVLLKEIVENPSLPIFKLSFLDDFERARLNERINSNYSKDFCYPSLQEIFEKQVELTPDAIAINCNGRITTYRKLNEQANMLAHYLILNCNIVREDIVALLIERSDELVIAILGILKAGGAYSIIDPATPVARVNEILKDCSPKAMIIDSKFVSMARNFDRHVFAIDIQLNSLEESNENLKLQYRGNDLAYIMYTSGSTGKPKGVMIENRGIVRLVHNTNYIRVTTNDRLLQTVNVSFDPTTFEIWGMLLNGATLYQLHQDQVLDPAFLNAFLKSNSITILVLITPLFHQLVDIDITLFSQLKYLIVGGDRISATQVNKVKEKYNSIKIVNAYGPTENTTISTYYEIFEKQEITVPIGNSITGSYTCILDPYKNFLPEYISGEIYVGGNGLARGYLNMPSQTHDKFIKHPFVEGEFMYATGDLGYFRNDGNIEFLGRKDSQVKIKGYRIELAGIEYVLRKHSSVQVVYVYAAKNNDRQYLNAAVVFRNNSENCSTEATSADPQTIHQDERVIALKNYCSNHLPDYMIPANFLVVTALPMTVNGKVDVSALEGIEADAKKVLQVRENPKDEKEQLVYDTWKEILLKDDIDLNDDFFKLGGDSIKAIQLATRLYNAGYDTGVRDIFLYPSISRLASKMVKRENVVLQYDKVVGDVPLTPIQVDFFEAVKTDFHHYNQSILVRVDYTLEMDMVRTVFSKIQEHHDMLRATFHQDGDSWRQTIGENDYPLSVQEIDIRSEERWTEKITSIAEDTQRSIDLKNGPLMRVVILHTLDGDRILVVIHHLVIDWVSWRVLLEDIETLMKQYKDEEELRLPGKTDSFKLWAERISAFANSPFILNESSHWDTVMSTAVDQIERDYETGNNLFGDLNMMFFQLSEQETSSLLTEVNDAFNTDIVDILLTGLLCALKETFNASSFAVMMEGHGRECIIDDININRTIGWFTTAYPVVLSHLHERLDLQIIGVKENLRKVPSKGIGYGLLNRTRSAYQIKAHENLNPQILFNYTGQFDSDLAKSTFQLAREQSGNPISPKADRKFDFEISGSILDMKLEMNIKYNKKHFKKTTIELMLASYKEALLKLISYCINREKNQLTPSDFTYKGLSDESLEKINQLFK